MRPRSIRQFEAAFWLWLALSLASIAAGWGALGADPNMAIVLQQLPWFPHVIVAVLAALLVWLGLAASRRRSQVARWLFVLLAVLSIGLVARSLIGGAFVGTAADWLGVVAAGVAVGGRCCCCGLMRVPGSRPIRTWR